jgi:hypothetical protein
MKTKSLFGLIACVAVSLNAAESAKDEVLAAAKQLEGKANYSWKTTVVVPEDARFKPGPSDGKTEKDGVTHITMSFGDNKMQAVMKGAKAAALTQDGEWKTSEELENAEGPGRWLGMMLRNMKTPAQQAAELASFAKDLKKDGEVYSSDLTEEGATTLQRFGRRGGQGGASVTDAKGWVKFWMKDGVLSKYEFKLSGTMKFNENEFQNDRTTTVEIHQVGTTKVEIPEEARKKIS